MNLSDAMPMEPEKWQEIWDYAEKLVVVKLVKTSTLAV